MPSHDKDPGDPSESGNPFISFRRLVDDHLSSAIRALNEQAGITSQQRTASSSSDTPDEALSALFNIFGQPPFHGLAPNRMREMDALDEPQSGKPSSQLWGCFLRHAQSSNEQELDFGLCEQGTYPWWRHYSRYSPDNLVRDKDAPRDMQPFWHRAFIDLMATHNDQAMASCPQPAWTAAALRQATYDLHSTGDARASVWTDDQPLWNPNSMFKPYLVSRKFQSLPAKPGNSLEEDMYRLFLTQQDAQRRAVIPNAVVGQEQASAGGIVDMVKKASRGEQSANEAEESPIIAMVTTSHTTTLPDGSSRTVRRFKKTFADGKEESSEDIQDNHTQTPMAEACPKQTEQKKKGWFWN